MRTGVQQITLLCNYNAAPRPYERDRERSGSCGSGRDARDLLIVSVSSPFYSWPSSCHSGSLGVGDGSDLRIPCLLASAPLPTASGVVCRFSAARASHRLDEPIMQARAQSLREIRWLLAIPRPALEQALRTLYIHSSTSVEKPRAGGVEIPPRRFGPPESIVAALRCSYPSDSSLERLCTRTRKRLQAAPTATPSAAELCH